MIDILTPRSGRYAPYTRGQDVNQPTAAVAAIEEVDNRIIVELGGDMESYMWTLNGKSWPEVTPVVVETVSIQFDADNPGVWPHHCHVLYHMEAGILTVLRYKDFIQPL